MIRIASRERALLDDVDVDDLLVLDRLHPLTKVDLNLGNSHHEWPMTIQFLQM